MTARERVALIIALAVAVWAALYGVLFPFPHDHDALPQTIVLPESALTLETLTTAPPPAAAVREEVPDEGIVATALRPFVPDVTVGAAEQDRASRPTITAPAAPTPTIRDLLDARFAQVPGGGEGDLFLAYATEAARVDRSLDLIATKDSPVSPIFTAEQILNRYKGRAAFDVVLRSVGWDEADLDQAWAVTRCEARGSYSGGPPGTVDRLAVGPGDELGWFQIHPTWWDIETAERHETTAVFAEFDLFNEQENALAGLYLFENGGWEHWRCFTLGLAPVD